MSRKLHNHWDGPYYITQECPNHTYTLRKCADHKQVPSCIHANRLKPYDNPDHRKSLDPPQTPLADNHLLPDETQPNTQQNPEDQQNQNAVPPDHLIQAHNNHPQPPLNRRTTAYQHSIRTLNMLKTCSNTNSSMERNVSLSSGMDHQ